MFKVLKNGLDLADVLVVTVIQWHLSVVRFFFTDLE